MKIKLFYQLIRFGITGVTAACVQLSIVITLVELYKLKPLHANIIAFFFAFQVSYWGHRCWTFASAVHHHVALPRLLLVSTSVFAANEGLFYIFLNFFQLQYIVALFLVLTVLPIITFLLNKFWVFK